MTQSIGFIGLGQMGAPMARNLLRAGFKLRVYNRTPEKAQAVVADGAELATSPAQTVEAGGVAITMVANDTALQEITTGPGGIAEALGSGGVHISMSTISPVTARNLAAIHAKRGSHYVAAPVFGRPEAAAAKKLWICQSGAAQAKSRVRPALEAMGQGIHDFGEEPSTAHVVKLCGNFMILSVMESLGEALVLAEKNGIDRAKLTSFFTDTIFSCPVYKTYGRIIAERAYEPAGFPVELGLKDASLIVDTAAQAGIPMPVAQLVRERMLTSVEKGRGKLDWTAIELLIAEAAGLKK